MKVVDVKTESGFAGVFISMSEMPGGAVLDMMSSEGGAQMMKMFQMFKMALVDQDLMETVADMPYEELSDAIEQWTNKSAKKDTRDAEWK